jgi:hypothetical protein
MSAPDQYHKEKNVGLHVTASTTWLKTPKKYKNKPMPQAKRCGLRRLRHRLSTITVKMPVTTLAMKDKMKGVDVKTLASGIIVASLKNICWGIARIISQASYKAHTNL